MDIILFLLLLIPLIIVVGINMYLWCLFLANVVAKIRMQSDERLIARVKHMIKVAEEDSYKGYQ